MNDDVAQAFAHPSVRADAMRTGQPLDRISLRDHIVDVEIGAFQAERGTTQRVSFNVVVEVAPIEDAVEDDVDRILSYDRVTEAIETALGLERLNLLETLAAKVAELILIEPQAVRAFVRIEKLDRGPGALGVEIVRSRQDVKPAISETDDTPHPHVLFLGNDAIADPKLAETIDRLAGQDMPLILCVGLGDTPAPAIKHKMAQRRIDLLAIEQNAWCLAARDDRFIVVDTRTELDWGMRHGQISVWAPSKMVLDAVEGPASGPTDAAHLVGWFAQSMQAARVSVFGVDPPDVDGVPVHHLEINK